jgi:hypothetical protein
MAVEAASVLSDDDDTGREACWSTEIVDPVSGELEFDTTVERVLHYDLNEAWYDDDFEVA